MMGTIDRSPSILRLEGTVAKASAPQLEEIINESGILFMIVSSLTLSDAIRTSVLSSRWRHLWTGFTKFDFNAITMLDAHTLEGCNLDSEGAYHVTKGKTAKFIMSVDAVTRQLQGFRVDEFTVRFFLHKTHSQHIDAWVRIAVASKTRSLHLHLFRPYTNLPIEPYEFQCQLLESTPFIESLTLTFCSLNLPRHFDGLSHLKELVLCGVFVDEEDFNCILSNCSSTLIKLTVRDAPWLTSISIPHSLSQLQCLKVKDCYLLRIIEINAKNLCRLTYRGVPVDFNFEQSLKLEEVRICFKYPRTVNTLDYYLAKFTSSLKHLEYLTLKMVGDYEVADLPKGSSRFNHLIRLDLQWKVGVKMNFFHLDTLLDVAPLLEELKLCLELSMRVEEKPHETPSKLGKMIPKHPHTSLKTIEVSGFYFNTWQIEIAAYLLKNAVKLESMTIKKGSRPWFVSKKRCKTGKKILIKEVPDTVKLVF